MKKEEEIYLEHMRDALIRIIEYTRRTKGDFLSDHMVQDATIRQYEILGEAAKRVSEKTRQLNPNIPWRKIAGMRDKSIHDYMGVNIVLYWETARAKVQSLLRGINAILAKGDKRHEN